MSSPEDRIHVLASEYYELQELHSSAPERRRPVIELALDSARMAIGQAFNDSEVQEAVQHQQTAIEEDIEFVERFVRQGRLSEEQASEQLKSIMEHEDYHLLRIAHGLGLVGAAQGAKVVKGSNQQPEKTSGSPDQRDAQSTPEYDAESTMAVIIDNDALIINGERYPDTVHGATKARKVAVLKVISEMKPGETISGVDLWKRVIPRVNPKKRHLMTSAIVPWLRQIAVSGDKKPVLAHNGKRGVQAVYERNGDVDLVLIDRRQLEKPGDDSTRTEAAHNGELEKPELRLVFDRDKVQIGKGRGKVISYSRRSYSGQKDYTEERKQALLYIVENAGKKVTPNDIWAAVYGEDQRDNIDNNIMGQISRWFNKLAYRKQPLVVHRGRGPGSRYWFSPEFVPVVVRKDIDSGRDNDVSLGSSKGEGSSVETAREPHGLDIQSVHCIALSLQRFNRILDDHGKPVITDDIIEPLKMYALRDSDSEKSIKIRFEAVEKMKKLLEDEELLVSFLSLSDSEDPRAKFAEFMWDLVAGDDHIELIDSLLGARIVEDNSHFIVMDESGKQIWPETNPAAISEEEAHGQDMQGRDEKADNRKMNRKTKRLEVLNATIREVVDQFAEGLDLDREYLREVVESRVQGFTRDAIAKAARSGICENEPPGGSQRQNQNLYKVHDVVRIVINSDKKLRDLFAIKSYRAEIEEKINRIVEQTKRRHAIRPAQ